MNTWNGAKKNAVLKPCAAMRAYIARGPGTSKNAAARSTVKPAEAIRIQAALRRLTTWPAISDATIYTPAQSSMIDATA